MGCLFSSASQLSNKHTVGLPPVSGAVQEGLGRSELAVHSETAVPPSSVLPRSV